MVLTTFVMSRRAVVVDEGWGGRRTTVKETWRLVDGCGGWKRCIYITDIEEMGRKFSKKKSHNTLSTNRVRWKLINGLSQTLGTVRAENNHQQDTMSRWWLWLGTGRVEKRAVVVDEGWGGRSRGEQPPTRCCVSLVVVTDDEGRGGCVVSFIVIHHSLLVPCRSPFVVHHVCCLFSWLSAINE